MSPHRRVKNVYGKTDFNHPANRTLTGKQLERLSEFAGVTGCPSDWGFAGKLIEALYKQNQRIFIGPRSETGEPFAYVHDQLHFFVGNSLPHAICRAINGFLDAQDQETPP